LLVEKGARLDVKNRREQTPLMLATAQNREAIANLLRKLGARE
jgi:ankyrin repeat protein